MLFKTILMKSFSFFLGVNFDQADMFGDRRGLREGYNENFLLEI